MASSVVVVFFVVGCFFLFRDKIYIWHTIVLQQHGTLILRVACSYTSDDF